MRFGVSRWAVSVAILVIVGAFCASSIHADHGIEQHAECSACVTARTHGVLADPVAPVVVGTLVASPALPPELREATGRPVRSASRGPPVLEL